MSNIQIGNGNTIYTVERANDVNFFINKKNINIKDVFDNISNSLLSYRDKFADNVHIDRDATHTLYDLCKQDVSADLKSKIVVVDGSAGMGKSVIMHDLLNMLLNDENVGVLGIKADRIVNNAGIAKDMLDDSTPLIDLIKEYAGTVNTFVLLVDQIDALSQSLSNDRRAIDYQDNLIKLVIKIPNAKVVVSCRPYDLQYDPVLEEYSKYKKVRVDNLTNEEITGVLMDAGLKYDNLSSTLMRFLSVPLHLYLYCKLSDKLPIGEDITLQKMYSEIWRQYIVIAPRKHGLEKSSIIALLGKIADDMFDKQSLFVHYNLYEDTYEQEISFLSTNGILVVDKSVIQFFHQSFFDYTYARLFVDAKKSLTAELKKAHQGLFIRQRVKQILSYERETDPNAYEKHLEEIFSNEGIYRFHIQMLVLSTIGSFENILPCEEQFINGHILNVDAEQPSKVFIESISSRAWLIFVINSSYAKDAIKNIDIEKIKELLTLCFRLMYSDGDIVLGFLDRQICSIDNEDVKNMAIRVIGNNEEFANKDAKLLKSIYYKLYDETKGITMPQCLRWYVKIDPTFVEEELLKDLKIRIETLDDFNNLRMDYEISEIYEELSKQDKDLWFDILFKSILMILDKNEKTDIHGTNGRLRYSSSFVLYKRKEPYQDYFNYELVDNVSDLLEKESKECPQWVEEKVKQLEDERFILFQQLIILAYTSNVEYFKQAIFEKLTDKSLLEDYYFPSITYYATLMLNASFNLFNHEEKRLILDTIMSLRPELEKTPMKGANQYGMSLTNIGITTGYYLHALGDEILEAYPKEHKEYHKLLEKYISLDCTPSKMQSQIGWRSLPKENRKKMSDKDIMKSLVSFPAIAEIGKPDATGTNIAFGQDTAEEPERYSKIINKLLNDDKYSISSISEGIKGLIHAKYDINVVYDYLNRAIQRLGDFNKANEGDIITLLRLAEMFIAHPILPKFIVDFICNVLTQHNDDWKDDGRFEADLYNTGINTVNGCAGKLLVDCNRHKEYKDQIFETLEAVAPKASVATRSAILLELRKLCNLDRDRTRYLFLALMHDCDPRLLAMPLHDYNALLCFAGSHYLEISGIVKYALSEPRCFHTFSVFLWLAYYNGNATAKEALLTMVYRSHEAQKSLLQYIIGVRDENTKAFIDEFFFKFLNSNSQDVGLQYEILFNHLLEWDENEMKPFVDAYTISCVAKFASRDVFGFLEKSAAKYPHDCLKWIIAIYGWKKKMSKDSYSASKILSIITAAYNGIHKYNKDDKMLDDALDIFDEILKDDNIRNATRGFLYKLDEE